MTDIPASKVEALDLSKEELIEVIKVKERAWATAQERLSLVDYQTGGQQTVIQRQYAAVTASRDALLLHVEEQNALVKALQRRIERLEREAKGEEMEGALPPTPPNEQAI